MSRAQDHGQLKAAKSFESHDFVDDNPPQLAAAQDHIEADWQQVDQLEPLAPATKRGSRLAKLVLLALLVLIGAEAGYSVWQAWLRGPLWFGLYAAVIGGALVVIGRLGWRELSRLRMLKRNQRQRQTGIRLLDSTQAGEADKLLEELSVQLPVQFNPALEEWQHAKQAHHNDAEQLQLYEAKVLRQQDIEAQRCIYRYAAQASLLLAASPMASLDMALMLWRNQSMLDEVARIYGVEPGYWSRVRLIKQIVRNLLFAGGSQVALDLGTQMLSAELTGKLSARVAQGLGAGLLTARLGYAACAECRPLPYAVQMRPSLLSVQGKLLAELKNVSVDALNLARSKAATAPPRNEQFTNSNRYDRS
ncbi:TIGR01620 family protein [Ferrimonas senticii]|uniref:TIGR01620 family protein n=1 Tax=Ferrimonas senticii TaxID=394566 RepID=UPI000404C531|nr:TIGR01620 family protein [Ferrimonas senticii]